MSRFLPLAVVAFHLLVCLQTLCDQQQAAASAGLVPPRVVIIVCAVPNAQLHVENPLPLQGYRPWRARARLRSRILLGREVNIPNNSTDYPRYFCGFTSGSKKQFLVVYDAKVDPLCKNNDKHECYCALPNTSPLKVRCLAKGDDRGTHSLDSGQELYWQFNPYYASGNPIYFCRFNWGSKQKTLVVYDIELDPLCKHNDTYECHWFVSSNGFYFSNDAMEYRRRAVWA
ncbi:hypothetical protein RHGRI_003717 [Rhododendron griersonianum]|uniref:S-protein homolog n=1 Tax=Rhododendron griersonianum TaxID=479676 RepID=A0AAV6L6V3_9ERIC|nr:hypothetical protein RHGRI_003717 [Rhododendron griersonianum]